MLKKLVGYTAVMFGASTVTGLLSFGVTALGLNLLSKETYGEYNAYVMVFSVGQGLFIYGVNQCIQREAATDDTNRLRFVKLAYLLFAALLALSLIIALPARYVYGAHFALGIVILPFTVAAWWCRYIVRSQLDAKREAFFNSLASLGTSLFQLGFLVFSSFPDSLIYGDFLALCLAALIPLSMLPSSQGVSFATVMRTPVPRDFLVRNLKFARANWLSGQVSVAANKLTEWISLNAFGHAGLGSVGAMNNIWGLALRPMDQLAQATLPGLVSAKERRAALHRDLMCLCLVVFPILGAGVAVGSPLLLQVMGIGEKYAELPSFLVCMATAVPVGVFQMIHNQLAVARGDSRFSLYGQIGQLVGAAGASLLLIGPLRLLGLVVAGVVGTIANAGALFWCMRDDPEHDVKRAALWTALATVGVVASMVPFYLLRAHPLAWLTGLLVPFIHGAAVFAFGILRPADVRRVVDAIKARRARKKAAG